MISILSNESIGVDWLDFELTSGVVLRLIQEPTSVETRDLLKPLFKLCKETSRYFNFQTAFKYAAFIDEVSTSGYTFTSSSTSSSTGTSVTLPPQAHLQPKYAYNTLVVMAQRASRPEYAMRAYEYMRQHSYEPDVFTLTALIDVVGRHDSFQTSLDLFISMMDTPTCLPNIVTFVTMLRLARMQFGQQTQLGIQAVLIVLDCAEELYIRSVAAPTCKWAYCSAHITAALL